MTAKVLTADFSNVKDGGGQFTKRRMPAAEYLAVIKDVADSPGKKDGVDQYLFTLQLKNHPSATYPYYCKLVENQLWKLRTLLIAAGIQVPKRRMKVDPNRAVGKLVGVLLEDDEYEGREQSVVQRVFPAAELSDIPSEDDGSSEDAPADADVEDASMDDLVEDELEEEETPQGDELDGLDRNELKKVLKELDSEAKVFKSTSDDDLRTQIRDLRSKATASGDEEDLDEIELDDL